LGVFSRRFHFSGKRRLFGNQQQLYWSSVKKDEGEIKVQVGTPNEGIIPMAVRKHLRNYMQTVMKIANPKFYLMFNPMDKPPHTIMFNFSRSDFRNEADYQNTLGSLAWVFSKNRVYRLPRKRFESVL